MNAKEKPIGWSKEAGWMFGLRRTFPFSHEYLWDFIFSEEGLKIWLGELAEALEIKKAYKTKAGIEGVVRVFAPYSHIRMSWKKEIWENISTVQVRIIKNREKTTVSFHQEKLLDNRQREEMKLYWNEKMDELEKAIAGKYE